MKPIDCLESLSTSTDYRRSSTLSENVKMTKTEACASGLGERGHGLAPTCGDSGIVDNG